MITIKYHYVSPDQTYFVTGLDYIVLGWVDGGDGLAKAIVFDRTNKPRIIDAADTNSWSLGNMDRVVSRQILEPFV